MPETTKAILARLDAIAEEQPLIRADVQATRTSFEHRIRNGRRVIAMLLALTVVSGYASFTSRRAADRASDAVTKVNATIERQDGERVERARGACVQFNVNQQSVRVAVVSPIIGAFRAFIAPDKAAELEQFQTLLTELAIERLPYRDCTDAGIDAFLKNPPVDPATGG